MYKDIFLVSVKDKTEGASSDFLATKIFKMSNIIVKTNPFSFENRPNLFQYGFFHL